MGAYVPHCYNGFTHTARVVSVSYMITAVFAGSVSVSIDKPSGVDVLDSDCRVVACKNGGGKTQDLYVLDRDCRGAACKSGGENGVCVG